MIVACCEHKNRRTNGVTKSGAVRYRCRDCGKSWTESTNTLGGLRIGLDRAAQVVELLCEGNSIRATSRITGVCKGTVLDLMTMIGQLCDAYMQENIKGVFVDSVQVDEIWGYVLCKMRPPR
jgi:transposase-like protein